jgi:hypothetical protein
MYVRTPGCEPEHYGINMLRALRVLACLGPLLALVTVVTAQATGQLAGVVRDNSGGVLPGASLTIANG